MKGDELQKVKKQLAEVTDAYNQMQQAYQELYIRNGETERKKYAYNYIKDLLTSKAISIDETQPTTYVNRLEVLAEALEGKFKPKEQLIKPVK